MRVQDKAISLGHPSYVWGFGQERRLALVRKHLRLEGKRILDIGCGVGVYVQAFLRFSREVYGVDLDWEKLIEGNRQGKMLATAASEHLPFPDNTFDITFLHEVIEHVANDTVTVREAYRVTKPGGSIVIYAPNRLFPFETHGFYLGQRYIFGNIPLVNYLPDPLRQIFCHHVRAYTHWGLRRLFDGLAVETTTHGYVYPGFDKLSHRNPILAQSLRKMLFIAENTPLAIFGLSHFLIARKDH